MREPDGTRDYLERYATIFNQRELIPILEISKFFSIDERTLTSDKNFPKVRIGRYIYVNIYALAKYMATQERR